MKIVFQYSDSFEIIRSKIEDHLFQSVFSLQLDEVLALQSIETFNVSLYRLCDILENMYKTPILSDLKGEKSFPIHNGR